MHDYLKKEIYDCKQNYEKNGHCLQKVQIRENNVRAQQQIATLPQFGMEVQTFRWKTVKSSKTNHFKLVDVVDLIDQNVTGREITMHDIVLVQFAHNTGQLIQNARG